MIAVAVLQYHLYDIRLVIRRVVVYGGLTAALTALFVGVYFAVLAALSGQLVAVRYRWVAQAVRSPSVALALHSGPEIETVSVMWVEQHAALLSPLVYRGERLGEMRVGPRAPGEPYGGVDRGTARSAC
jgi:hypothetical protein